ncbi:Variable outer membrane protein (plasmid) [Borrelia crocidurae DOU]|uniref:Variable large protein n=1 Tax=Borrelia crocidurae DOU TaxID=1293575 RepID=W5SLF8_9SPIR|nr:Variable outer membrane protein [Borrelia crocidurae DOU]
MYHILMRCDGGVGKREQFVGLIVNLGKGFMEVFVSFGDMITETLGIKAETKKIEIGGYFSKIAETMKEVREKLGKILEENGKYEKVKGKVEEFIGKISKIEEGAKEASKGATGEAIGNAASAGHGATPANKESVISLVKGIKAIVGVVFRDNEDSADANKTGDDKKDIGNLFASDNGKDEAKEENIAKAAASIGTVSGADILKAVAKAKEDPKVDNAEGINAATDSAEIAVAKAVDNKKEIKEGAKKDAVIAAGIALRGMGKDGKFAAKAEEKSVHAVNGAVASAVNKVLSTLTIAIRNTVDEGLKGISEVLGEIKQGRF